LAVEPANVLLVPYQDLKLVDFRKLGLHVALESQLVLICLARLQVRCHHVKEDLVLHYQPVLHVLVSCDFLEIPQLLERRHLQPHRLIEVSNCLHPKCAILFNYELFKVRL
jgi:hypothetical protein